MSTNRVSCWLFRAWLGFLASRLRAEMGATPELLQRDSIDQTETPRRNTEVAACWNSRSSDNKENPRRSFAVKTSFAPAQIGVL